MINWKVRAVNKAFWLALIPALALLVTAVCEVFGIKLDLTGITAKLVAVVEAVFAVLVVIGVVNDPTTKGIKDSDRAMTYQKPWQDEEE